MKLVFINQQKDFRVPKGFLEKKFIKTNNLLRRSKDKSTFIEIRKQILAFNSNFKSMTLVFLDPIEIKKLNLYHRGINKPTDVLSFRSEDPDIFGELIFCPEIIFDQASANSWSQQNEYLYMLIHGLLHLLGLDHKKELEAQKMFKLQDQIFNSVTSGPKIEV